MASRTPILVYTDDGADEFCAQCLLHACRELHGAVESIDAARLLAGGWQGHCAGLAFPGGADRPYAAKLNGPGNALIREYVERGGRYLGVCAGAYYACRRIDFTGADFTACEERELAFFPGTAVGSLNELAPAYRVQDLSCAAAVDLETSAGPVTTLYWGGCCFVPDAGAEPFDVLARYRGLATERSIAAVRARVGKGQAVLTGFHAEIGSDALSDHRDLYPDRDDGHVDALVGRLKAGEAARQGLFHFLLRAMGLAQAAAAI
jgi:glutamine amidotransferase-like uncharacterized protein